MITHLLLSHGLAELQANIMGSYISSMVDRPKIEIVGLNEEDSQTGLVLSAKATSVFSPARQNSSREDTFDATMNYLVHLLLEENQPFPLAQ